MRDIKGVADMDDGGVAEMDWSGKYGCGGGVGMIYFKKSGFETVVGRFRNGCTIPFNNMSALFATS